jgi:Toastrack DUF4097
MFAGRSPLSSLLVSPGDCRWLRTLSLVSWLLVPPTVHAASSAEVARSGGGSGTAQGLGEEFVVPLSLPERQGSLAVHLNNGSIRLIGEDRQDVAVEMRIASPLGEVAEVPAGMHPVATYHADLEVTEERNTVTLRSHSGRELELSIAVPAGFDVELRIYEGSTAGVHVEGLDGSIVVRSAAGPITLEGTSSSVVAHAEDGELRVRVRHLDQSQPLSLTTDDGDIHLTLPRSAPATASIHSDSGRVFSDLELTPVRVFPRPDSAPGPGQSYRLRLEGLLKHEINGGGVSLVLKSLEGDIYLEAGAGS